MSDNLKMMLGRVPLPLLEPTPVSWQISHKRADFGAQSALPICHQDIRMSKQNCHCGNLTLIRVAKVTKN